MTAAANAAILAEGKTVSPHARGVIAERIAPEGKYFTLEICVLRSLQPALTRTNTQVSTSDDFDRFADECSLRLTAEPLCVAPRDVLAQLEELEQHFLVSLTRAGTAESPVRLVFLAPLRAPGGPSMRDVLWWVAGDAWALDRADHNLTEWAAIYGYSETDDATAWLFERARRQATALAKLLGDSNMRRLLDLYEAEVGPSRSP